MSCAHEPGRCVHRCNHDQALDATSLCSRCRYVAYCGPGHQRADWSEHRPVCDAIAADNALPESALQSPACHGCGAALLNTEAHRCAGCRSISYCSAECARAKWTEHRAVCKHVGAAKFARAVESATAGSLDAVFNTGLFHEHGTGTDVSPSDALACFRRAADGGHALAQNKLGYVYEHGSLGVAADASAAAAWYRKAANGGCSEGMYNFAVARQRGAGVQCDAADALRWFRRAAEAGVANAQFNVAVSLLSGGAGAEGSTDAAAEAVEWLTRAAQAGHVKAACNLGVCFQRGLGVACDVERALVWLKQAASAGHARATLNVGIALSERAASPEERCEAARWLERALASDDADVAATARDVLATRRE